ncbi:MAG: hypothetical protein V1754_10195, partial [Pseudomonadota bacterium]
LLGEQARPSVVGRGNDAFVVAFRDDSKAGPDIRGSGIRARIIYPDFQPTDGQIGATCNSSYKCDTTLSCVSTENDGSRCLPNCSQQSDCIQGGECKEGVCTYP